jgi:hypothetical protein
MKKEILQKTQNNIFIKTIIYVGIGIVSLFVIGKTFTVLASTIRGFNELKLAMNGN